MRALVVLIFVLSFQFSYSQLNHVEIDAEFIKARKQYHVLKDKLGEKDRFPRTYDQAPDELKTSGSEWWCSGFYPGSLLYLYEQTQDELLYKEALRMLNLLEKEQYNTSTHDLGFMMYCSFGNAYRIAPSEKYKDVIIQSARSLASRFSPVTGTIRSWNSKSVDFLVIIDNMMNLELLFEASLLTGDSTYYNIAVTHANTTMKNHFREDHSSYHVVNYDPETGKVKQKRTHQGYADESAWPVDKLGVCMAILWYTDTRKIKNIWIRLSRLQNIHLIIPICRQMAFLIGIIMLRIYLWH